jgi:hypothetical protein
MSLRVIDLYRMRNKILAIYKMEISERRLYERTKHHHGGWKCVQGDHHVDAAAEGAEHRPSTGQKVPSIRSGTDW